MRPYKSEFCIEYFPPNDYQCECGAHGTKETMITHKKYEGHKCGKCFIKFFWNPEDLIDAPYHLPQK